jgi:hypothetical protein
MRTLFLVTAFLCSATATAKPWNGIDPGVSTRADVLKKFGNPTKTVATSDGKEVLAYLNTEAIKGTIQSQFKVDKASQTVERIDVFPAPLIDKDTIENSYGPQCPQASQGTAAAPCYLKKLTDTFQTYFVYPKLGLAIFFKDDGKTVQSFAFQTVARSGAPGTAKD